MKKVWTCRIYDTHMHTHAHAHAHAHTHTHTHTHTKRTISGKRSSEFKKFQGIRVNHSIFDFLIAFFRTCWKVK